jgi:hypothetical protein
VAARRASLCAVSVDLGRRLLASGAVKPSDLQASLAVHASRGKPLARVLVDRGVLTEETLEEELARSRAPAVAAIEVAGELAASLPTGICRALGAVPVGRDEAGVSVAALDPDDPHVAREMTFHLGVAVRVVRARWSVLEPAIERAEAAVPGASPAHTRHETPYWGGAPARPSEPPIPLVRRVSRAPSPSDTFHGHEGPDAEPIELLPSRLPPPAARDANPPPTRRGPFAPYAPIAPFEDLGPFLSAIRGALQRDSVLRNVVAGLSAVARRVGIFAIKREGFRGIECNPHLGDESAFRAICIDAVAPSILATAVAKGSYLGPLPETRPHEALRRLLGTVDDEVLASVVKIGEKPALVLFADQIGDTMAATRRAEELGHAAGEALSRIVQAMKSERP